MKKVKMVLSCIILLCLSMNMVSCGKNESEKHPSNYEQLSGLIGKEYTGVLEQLGITEEEMQELAVGLYKTPEKVTFLDGSYDVLLTFDETSNKMYGFCYQETFSDEAEVAEKRVALLLEQFVDFYGEPDTYEGISGRLKNQTGLREKFTGRKTFSAYELWNVSDTLDLYLIVSSDGEANVTIQLQYQTKV